MTLFFWGWFKLPELIFGLIEGEGFEVLCHSFIAALFNYSGRLSKYCTE
jgi:hypothetical protein